MMLILAYAVSGWMINREYHTEYFLLIAVAAAMHRLCLKEQQSADVWLGEDPSNSGNVASWPVSPMQTALTWPVFIPAVPIQQETKFHVRKGTPQAFMVGSAEALTNAPPPVSDSLTAHEEDGGQDELRESLWNRLTGLDVVAAVILTWAVIYIWEYILKNL